MNVQKMISATADIAPGQRYSVPEAQLARYGAMPAIVVIMLPWRNVLGALDTLCLVTANNRRPAIAACVNEFAVCSTCDGWPDTKAAKMKLRSLLAAAHYDDPYIPPAYVGSERTDLVPLDDSIFNQIEEYLRSFPALVR